MTKIARVHDIDQFWEYPFCGMRLFIFLLKALMYSVILVNIMDVG
jgi:hypothetical protein